MDTKGEWVAKFNGVTNTWEVGTTNGAANIGIAKLWSGKGYEANAHLIAAAPRLHKELTNLVTRIEQGLALGEKLDLESAREALAKAEGK